ncbi:VOC family protein [Paenibacillus sp. S150]|uniref:VOC family protein n=1 Tax=Paenibacillus sp. S150 TaxID=2749826 RepID=UPI001C595C29|nr:VOC family protein [Paenibacillus sp. S150]MBW4080466.1 VOC family protein [Paenibacillus sp. S150]
MNRISLITLGVRDMSRSLQFYRDGLGFETSVSEESPGIVFFNTAGTKLALYPLEGLAEDINDKEPPTGSGFSGITLAHNTKSQNEVNEIMKRAEQAGGTIIKQPQKVFWGGYSGYFSDPDGYYWEVAYSEDWKFDSNDMLIIG